MKVIGIDVDGTLARYEGWQGGEIIGSLLPGARKFLETLKADGWTICLWSTRPTYLLQRWAAQHAVDHHINFYNESPYPADSAKASFDVYVGDETYRFDGDYDHLFARITTSRHWGEGDTFDRDVTWADENPTIFYRGTGKMYVDMFDAAYRAIWQRRVIDRGKWALLTICSHAKPYSKSYIHGSIRQALYNAELLHKVDYIHLSNAGIIPHQNGMDYPFNAYDWNASQCAAEVKAYQQETLTRRLVEWMQHYGPKYRGCVVYLRAGGTTLKAVQQAALKANYPCTFVTAPDIVTPLPWMLHGDPDDCLVEHVHSLVTALQEEGL